MSPMRTTFWRTLGRARNIYATGFTIAGFLAVSAVLFVFALEDAEGGTLALAPLWTLTVARVLPAFAALLAMDVWSDERMSGRIDFLLASPVRERDLVLGKFFGVFCLMFVTIVFFLTTTLSALSYFAPSLLVGVNAFTFIPGLAALALQGGLWCAVAVAVSSQFRRPAASGSVSLLLAALPYVAWLAFVRWLPGGAEGQGDMPLDAHILDIASGSIPVGMVVAYVLLTLLALLFASKFVLSLRFVGTGARTLRVSTITVLALGVVCTVLAVLLAIRLDTTVDISVGRGEITFSPRTRGVLGESRGDLNVTCFLPRADRRFRAISHFLRALQRESLVRSGARIRLHFVDPRWDLGGADRLVRIGVEAPSIVFERNRRCVSVPIDDSCGERVCTSAILRLMMPPQRRNIYWTHGHGECAFDSYGVGGLSDIARELSRDGYENHSLELLSDTPIPSDCALIVIAGARDDFSRAETARIDAYLKQGGRLLVLVEDGETGGVSSLLPAWGLRPTVRPLAGLPSLSNGDVVLSDFTSHPISAPLKGSQVVLVRPVAFSVSAAAGQGDGVDRLDFSTLALAGGSVFAAAVERGAGVGADTAIRPTRIVAIGDVSFVTNGQLASLANANRDFFLNCVAYLSGSHALTSVGADGNRLVSGLSIRSRKLLVLVTGGALPVVVLALLFLIALRRRNRG